jgi:hypothetical protein
MFSGLVGKFLQVAAWVASSAMTARCGALHFICAMIPSNNLAHKYHFK